MHASLQKLLVTAEVANYLHPVFISQIDNRGITTDCLKYPTSNFKWPFHEVMSVSKCHQINLTAPITQNYHASPTKSMLTTLHTQLCSYIVANHSASQLELFSPSSTSAESSLSIPVCIATNTHTLNTIHANTVELQPYHNPIKMPHQFLDN